MDRRDGAVGRADLGVDVLDVVARGTVVKGEIAELLWADRHPENDARGCARRLIATEAGG